MRQLPLGLGPDEPPGFDNFFAGPNAAVIDHLRGLERQARPAPVYLWGERGAGKTHLLRALVHEMQAPGGRVGWFDAAAPRNLEFDDTWRLLVLDDCQGYDADQQQRAFALFVQATTQGLPIAAAGNAPPVDLPLRDDLRTRLGWGHVFHLLPLSESDCRAVLRREADRRGIFLSDEVMSYLLTRFSRDLGSLMGLLNRLDRFALATHRAVTVPLLKQMLAEEGT
ncbi:DnaA regulatory inactivator Hda [Schlegelella sp. S2-27]|uniref:DnaA regulatory inactivator Hda n=1 Tax=Caldimonas mangrovi TaxID=2944811 RepID=A0ABT0YII2_9BURK|nr:DnaA regulatory inactivator Hda [Caldimonas mangrovi]MCM5678017.1 DnaA regulatory inactivator Hda [Caldimonas mangrovi]